MSALPRLNGHDWRRLGLRDLRVRARAHWRHVRNLIEAPAPPHYTGARLPYLHAETLLGLPTEPPTGVPEWMHLGKYHNVTLAATALDGLALGPARPFSFWRTVGPLTAARGFRPGLSLADGCAVPTIGGGVCALTNAVFALAVGLGWTLLEHHPHSRAIADVHALDATVAYPHVDLRLRPLTVVVLSVRPHPAGLVLAVHGAAPVRAAEVNTRVVPSGDGFAVTHTRASSDGVEVIRQHVRTRLPVVTRTCVDCNQPCRAGDRYLRAAGMTREVACSS